MTAQGALPSNDELREIGELSTHTGASVNQLMRFRNLVLRQAAEQLRNASGSYGSPSYDHELGPGLAQAADLIDPGVQR